MKKIIAGKAVLLGDNIDTDQIYPGRFLDLVEPADIAAHCFEGVSAEAMAGAPGGVVLAGRNFGCGSSREHAVITLQSAGVKAVVAESFARIFFRNAVNLGFTVVTCKGVSALAEAGDEIELDMESGTVKNLSSGRVLEGERLSGHILSIIEAGGIKPLLRRKLAEQDGAL